MGNHYTGTVLPLAGLLLLLMAACAQSTTQQKVVPDGVSLPSQRAALEYLDKQVKSVVTTVTKRE